METCTIDWKFISTDGYPLVEKEGDYYPSVPVIIYCDDNRTHPVLGAFFTYQEDFLDKTYNPTFQTDEGILYNNVIAWALMPQPPNIKK